MNSIVSFNKVNIGNSNLALIGGKIAKSGVINTCCSFCIAQKEPKTLGLDDFLDKVSS